MAPTYRIGDRVVTPDNGREATIISFKKTSVTVAFVDNNKTGTFSIAAIRKV